MSSPLTSVIKKIFYKYVPDTARNSTLISTAAEIKELEVKAHSLVAGGPEVRNEPET